MTSRTQANLYPHADLANSCAGQVKTLADVSLRIAEMAEEVETSLALYQQAVEQLESVWQSATAETIAPSHESVRGQLEQLLSRFDDSSTFDRSLFQEVSAAIETIDRTGIVTVGQGLREFQSHERLALDLADRVESIREQFEQHWPRLDSDRIARSRREFADSGAGITVEEMLHDLSP